MILACPDCHCSYVHEDDEVESKGGPTGFSCGQCGRALATMADAMGVHLPSRDCADVDLLTESDGDDDDDFVGCCRAREEDAEGDDITPEPSGDTPPEGQVIIPAPAKAEAPEGQVVIPAPPEMEAVDDDDDDDFWAQAGRVGTLPLNAQAPTSAATLPMEKSQRHISTLPMERDERTVSTAPMDRDPSLAPTLAAQPKFEKPALTADDGNLTATLPNRTAIPRDANSGSRATWGVGLGCLAVLAVVAIVGVAIVAALYVL